MIKSEKPRRIFYDFLSEGLFLRKLKKNQTIQGNEVNN